VINTGLSTGGILPYATVTGPANAFDFASELKTSLNIIAAFDEYTLGFAGAGSNDTVKLVGPGSFTFPSGGGSVNAIYLSGDNIQLNSTVASLVIVASGAILNSGATTTGNTIQVITLVSATIEDIINIGTVAD